MSIVGKWNNFVVVFYLLIEVLKHRSTRCSGREVAKSLYCQERVSKKVKEDKSLVAEMKQTGDSGRSAGMLTEINVICANVWLTERSDEKSVS